MLVLFETPAGFALFKVLDEGKLSKVEDLAKEFSSPDSARKVVKLKAFSKFENTSKALEAATKIVDGLTTKSLRKFLSAHCDGEMLGVADSKLGNSIKEKLKIDCVHNQSVMELMRGVRSQLTELITGLGAQDLAPMSLGLSHSLSRYKLKFSPDKVDTMIVQAIGLLDDLDKELNIYGMRIKEWYGWHFPEFAKILQEAKINQDFVPYAKAVKRMGRRENSTTLDFSDILPEDIEVKVKEASVISMGVEISDEDLMNMKELCDQVISLAEYRAQLYEYLKSRMNTVAPTLTALVGELVGARLIAHGGSLMNLAKQPGSTIQILGAEKALFRALKTKHATPKYGLVFHASLVGQASTQLKGKMSRSLSAKAALAIRYDALGEGQNNSLGLDLRAKLEARLRNLENRALGRSSGSAKGKPKIEAYDRDKKKGSGGMITPAKTYNPASDAVLELTPTAMEMSISTTEGKTDKKKKKSMDEETPNDNSGSGKPEADGELSKKEKKKKKKHQAEEDDLPTEDGHAETGEKKKKKRKHTEEPVSSGKKDKKKKKKKNED